MGRRFSGNRGGGKISEATFAALFLATAGLATTEAQLKADCIKLGFVRQSVASTRYVATTNNRPVAGTKTATSSARRGYLARTKHVFAAGVEDVVVTVSGAWLITYNSGRVPLGNSFTTTKTAIEMNGITVPVTFAGGRGLTHIDSTDYYHSDPISPAAWGLTSATIKGQVAYLRRQGSVATVGQFIPAAIPSVSAADTSNLNTRCYYYDPDTDIVDPVDGTGYIVKPATALQQNYAPPAVIRGTYAAGETVKSWGGVGDSLVNGLTDNTGNNPFSGAVGLGIFDRASSIGGAQFLPAMNVGISSEMGSQFGFAGDPRIEALAWVHNYVTNYATNDIGPTGTGALSVVQSNQQAVWARLRTIHADCKIVHVNVGPRCSGTFAALATQTPNTGWAAAGDVAYLFNSWLATRVGIEINAVADRWSALNDNTETFKYDVAGGALTADGTHENATGCALVGPVIRAAIDAVAA